MVDLWGRGWVRWLAGFAFGAMLGLGFWVVGIFAVAIAMVALVLAIIGRWRLVFVSGWITGIGAMWIGVMVRAEWLCSTDPTCVGSSGTELWIWLGAGLVAVGALIGLWAWWRERRA